MSWRHCQSLILRASSCCVEWHSALCISIQHSPSVQVGDLRRAEGVGDYREAVPPEEGLRRLNRAPPGHHARAHACGPWAIASMGLAIVNMQGAAVIPARGSGGCLLLIGAESRRVQR